MKILITGVTGYIGKRLLIQLTKTGHELYCVVRNKARFNTKKYSGQRLHIIEADFENYHSLHSIPTDIDIAYYFLHSLGEMGKGFAEKEKRTALNFKKALEATDARQVIYLTGIVNEKELSDHLQSRKIVEETLASTQYALTAIRAGIIIGSGSASFEIMRDLVEKLPVMVAPKWIKTKCQPVAIRNVIEILMAVAGDQATYNSHYDIGGTDILTYKQMMQIFAEERKLKRTIITVPVMTPRLSSYWLYFITSVNYSLAKNLVDSMKIDVIAQKNDLAERYGIDMLSYRTSLRLAFDKIAQNDVLSTWADSFSDQFHKKDFWQFAEVPKEGCFTDKRQKKVEDERATLGRIFGIGGYSGWYSARLLWELRGLLDKLFGGVGLKRGRRNTTSLEAGDTVDFWRVLVADETQKKLLLFAEMKVPGEAWLEFVIKDGTLYQTATFRPKGLWGRMYWYLVLPFHSIIFKSMISKLSQP